MAKNLETKEFRQDIPLKDAGLFCREFTAWLTGDVSVLDAQVGSGDFKKMKLAIKRENGHLTIEMKVKRNPVLTAASGILASDSVGDSAGDSASERVAGTRRRGYKSLKKAMKDSYRILQTCGAENRLPDRDTVMLFIAQSEEMVTWPDKGTPLYKPYIDACRKMRVAFEANDVSAYNLALEEIDGLKKQAHHQYK